MDLMQARVHRRALIGAGALVATFGTRRGAVAAGTPTVRFAYFGAGEEHVAFERLVASFEAAHPEIAVESIALSSGDATLIPNHEKGSPYQPWLRASFATPNAPDVFLLNYRNLGELTSRGLVEPLGSYLAQSGTLREQDFYGGAIAAFRFRTADGEIELGGIPQNASSLAVYYNKGVFDEFGVPYPADSWRWEELAETASALTADRDRDGLIGTYGLSIDPSISRFAAFIWGAGGEFVDDPVTPAALQLDNDAARNGLRFLVSLGPAGRNVTPSEAKLREETDLSRFMNGRSAMFVHTRRIVPTLRAVDGLRWDVAPLPVGAQPANVLHTDALVMAKSSGNKDAAWAFIEYASGPEGQKLLAATGRMVPSLRAVAESDDFLSGSPALSSLGMGGLALPPQRSDVFLGNIGIARALPAIASWPGVEYAFNRSFRQAFYGDGDIDGAIARTYARATGLLGTSLTTNRNLFQGELSEAEE